MSRIAEGDTDLYICKKCGTEIKVVKGAPKPSCDCGGETIKVVVLK